MVILLSEIKYFKDTNSVEVTWIDAETKLQVRCHSYDQYQMDTLASDLGEDISNYQYIIDQVLASQTPIPEIDHNTIIKEQIAALESTMTERRIREAVLGIDNGWLANLNAQISVLRSQLT